METKKLIEEVTSLPVEERAIIADSILKTLNPVETDIEKKWMKVAKERLIELKSGKVKPISGDEVFNKIWKKYAL